MTGRSSCACCRLGLRASEVVRLRLDDIDWRAATVRVGGPQDGAWSTAAIDRRGGQGAGRVPPARPSGHHGERGVRAAQPSAWVLRSATASSGEPWTERSIAPGSTRPLEVANLLRHSLATGLLARGVGLSRDRRSARSLASGHDSDLRRGRYRSPAPGGAAVAGGETVTAPVMAAVEAYIAMRHGLGYRSPTQERSLRAFARYLDTANHRADPARSRRWNGRRRPRRPIRATRPGVWRPCGASCVTSPRWTVPPRCPPPGLLGPDWTSQAAARLLRRRDRRSVGTAAARLDPAGGLRPRCYVTLFGLLACTGLAHQRSARPVVRRCRPRRRGVITVRAGKRGLTRLVPLHPSAVAAAGRLRRRAGTLFGPPGPTDAFFRTEASERISYNTAHHAFRVVRRRLGWNADRAHPCPPGARPAPPHGRAAHPDLARPKASTSTPRSPRWPPTSATSRCVTSTGISPPFPS